MKMLLTDSYTIDKIVVGIESMNGIILNRGFNFVTFNDSQSRFGEFVCYFFN